MGKPAIEGGDKTRAEFLPFHRPVMGREEEEAVLEALRSGWITTGERSFTLEKKIAEMVKAAHGIAVNSCTSALHLALVAAGVKPGDEVITTPITFAATVNVIEHVGARPVFADVRLTDLNVDPALIEAAVTDRTRAIMPVHMAGIACDMDPILALAKKRGLTVIEDAAHALGTLYKDRPIGSLSPMTCFSFYATKNLTTGEGGMVTTNDDELAERLKVLRLHGISKDAWKRYGSSGYQHWEILEPGFKYNLSDVLAAIGLAQLDKFPAYQERRAKIVEMFDREFEEEAAIEVLKIPPYCKSAYHIYPLILDLAALKVDRDAIMNAVQAEGIGLGVHFRSVPEHPYYRGKYGYEEGSLANAELVSSSVFSVPLNPWLTDDDVHDITRAVKKVVSYYRK